MFKCIKYRSQLAPRRCSHQIVKKRGYYRVGAAPKLKHSYTALPLLDHDYLFMIHDLFMIKYCGCSVSEPPMMCQLLFGTTCSHLRRARIIVWFASDDGGRNESLVPRRVRKLCFA